MTPVATERGQGWICACYLAADPPDVDCVWDDDNGSRWQLIAIGGVVFTVGWDPKAEGDIAPYVF